VVGDAICTVFSPFIFDARVFCCFLSNAAFRPTLLCDHKTEMIFFPQSLGGTLRTFRIPGVSGLNPAGHLARCILILRSFRHRIKLRGNGPIVYLYSTNLDSVIHDSLDKGVQPVIFVLQSPGMDQGQRYKVPCGSAV